MHNDFDNRGAVGRPQTVIVGLDTAQRYDITSIALYAGTPLRVIAILVPDGNDWKKLEPEPEPVIEIAEIQKQPEPGPEPPRHYSLRPPRLPSIRRSLRKCARLWGKGGRVYLR